MNTPLVIGGTDVTTADYALAHLREGGSLKTDLMTYDHVERFMLVRWVDMGNGGQKRASDIHGYIHPDYIDSPVFWEWLSADQGVQSELVSAGDPHGGIVCEFSGEEIAPAWYIVGNSVGGASLYDGESYHDEAQYALEEAIEAAEQYTGMGDEDDPADFAIASIALTAKVNYTQRDGEADHRNITLTMTIEESGSGLERHMHITDGMGVNEHYVDEFGDETGYQYEALDAVKHFLIPDVMDITGSIAMMAPEGNAQRLIEISHYEG